MTDERFPREELAGRLERFQAALAGAELDGAIVLQRADLVWLTDAAFQGALLVPAAGAPRLFVWRGRGRIGDGCPAEPEPVAGMGKLPAAIAAAGLAGWRRVGFEEDVLPVAWYRRLVAGVWPGAEHADIAPALRRLRGVKSPRELERVRASGRVLAGGFEALRTILREGMPEYEAQARLDLAMRLAGDQAAGRNRGFNAEARGVVACGASAAVDTAFDGPIGQPGRYYLAPMGAGGGVIRAGAPVIADSTAGYAGYMTDMTRTYHIGPLDRRFVDAHNFCVHILAEVTRRLVPGAVPEELYQWAVDEAAAAGYAEHFMNRGENKVRFLGHGIGLEMDEVPILARRFTEPLAAGTVFAVEPKIIFDDGGVGVEDTIVVGAGGGEVVTPMALGLIQVG